MLEDEQHDKLIDITSQTWAHLNKAEDHLFEISHYITEDPHYAQAILKMVLARIGIEKIIFLAGIEGLPSGDVDG